jgi:hypothetical protein
MAPVVSCSRVLSRMSNFSRGEAVQHACAYLCPKAVRVCGFLRGTQHVRHVSSAPKTPAAYLIPTPMNPYALFPRHLAEL